MSATLRTMQCSLLTISMTVTGLLNGDAGDTDSSQETFEVSGSVRMKMSGMNCMSSRNECLRM